MFGLVQIPGLIVIFGILTMKKYRIDLPTKAIEQLELDKDASLLLMVDNKSLTIRPNRTFELLPQIMMRWYLIPAAIAAVAFFYLNLINHHWLIPLTGNWLIGFASLYLGTFSGLVAFAVMFVIQKDIIAAQQWGCIGAACRRC